MTLDHKKINLHGWLVVDKPISITSTDVVRKLRSFLNIKKIGHAGTLDPKATGILPIALGQATKTVSYVMNGYKTYRMILKFGEERNTDDIEGVITKTSIKRPSNREIENILKYFIGNIDQIPPVFSAIKVNGQRAYHLARIGEKVVLKKRNIFIKDLKFIERLDADSAVFDIISGKGAYMRSLGRDIALKLGTVGHITSLQRTYVSPFIQKQVLPLNTILTMNPKDVINKILPVESGLSHLPFFLLTQKEANLLLNGQRLDLTFMSRKSTEKISHIKDNTIFCAMIENRLIALVHRNYNIIQPIRVFNL